MIHCADSDTEAVKAKFLNAKVLFPGGLEPGNVGTVVDIYSQRSVDLLEENRGVVFLSDDELPDNEGNFPKRVTSPKILCEVHFDEHGGYMNLVEPGDLIIVNVQADTK